MTALAWRNLWRQRRRSLVTAGAVALVVLFSVMYFGLGGAMENSMYQRLTETGGHVQVRTPGWRDAASLDDTLIDDAAEVRATVQRIASERLAAPEVVGVLDVPALLSGDVRSRAVPVHGQDWPTAVRERRLGGSELEGRFLENPGEIVLGASLARALDVGLGDDVFVYALGAEASGPRPTRWWESPTWQTPAQRSPRPGRPWRRRRRWPHRTRCSASRSTARRSYGSRTTPSPTPSPPP